MKTKNHFHTKGDYSINSWKLGNERKNSFKFTKFFIEIAKPLIEGYINNLSIVSKKNRNIIDHMSEWYQRKILNSSKQRLTYNNNNNNNNNNEK